MSRRLNRLHRGRGAHDAAREAAQTHSLFLALGQVVTLNRAIAAQGCLLCGQVDALGMAWRAEFRGEETGGVYQQRTYWLCARHAGPERPDEASLLDCLCRAAPRPRRGDAGGVVEV